LSRRTAIASNASQTPLIFFHSFLGTRLVFDSSHDISENIHLYDQFISEAGRGVYLLFLFFFRCWIIRVCIVVFFLGAGRKRKSGEQP